ncbi:MAG: hypothetical protein ACLFP2_01740 [Candidatus Woesearchaeota archaeon]
MRKTSITILVIAFVCYLVSFFYDRNLFNTAVDDFSGIMIKIIPILFLVYIFIVLSNYYLDNKLIKKWFAQTKGIKGWLIVIIGGFLSAGPAYLWYPLLQDLRNKGMNDSFIACFVYTRSIKPYFLPVMIYYFGLAYTIALTIVMVVMGIIMGLIMQERHL